MLEGMTCLFNPLQGVGWGEREGRENKWFLKENILACFSQERAELITMVTIR
jgi:hypothetical protein